MRRTFSLRDHQTLARILVLSVVLLVLLGVYLLRYRSFVVTLRAFDMAETEGFAEQIFPLLDRDQITQLGAAHREGHRPRSSYTLADRPKSADTFRIGVFGCSFVYGTEAAPGQDFPSQLQRIFDAKGGRRVEVLNFGVGAFGVQQSYLLWQYLAGDFELDLTTYSLYGFHRHRDNSFIMLDTMYAPVHARYVLDGEDLRLIKVKGGDRRDAARGYFRLIPRWDYLRFDAKSPPMIRALLPEGRTMPANPFYYQSDLDEECSRIYGRIFSEMTDRSERFVVFVNDWVSEDLVGRPEASRTVESVRTSSERFTWERRGFCRAPKNHPSALGYRILATERHAILTGGKEALLPDVEIGGPATATQPSAKAPGLSNYETVYLSFGGSPAALFVTSVANRAVRPYSFGSKGTDSVLDVSGEKDPLYVALDGEIPGEDLRLKFSADGSPEEIVIGRIHFVGGRNVGVLESPKNAHRGDGWVIQIRPRVSAITCDLASDLEITDVRLDIGGVTVLSGDPCRGENSRVGRICWRSADGDLLETRGHPEQNADDIISAGAGDLCVTARTSAGDEASWCTRGWRLGSTTLQVRAAGVLPIG